MTPSVTLWPPSLRIARNPGIGYERPGFAWLLNAPSLLAIFVLAAYPIVYSAWISLHKYNLKRPRVFDFIGLSNYASILQSSAAYVSSNNPNNPKASGAAVRRRRASRSTT